MEWLLENYSKKYNANEESFNVYYNKAKIRVENAFGRLLRDVGEFYKKELK